MPAFCRADGNPSMIHRALFEFIGPPQSSGSSPGHRQEASGNLLRPNARVVVDPENIYSILLEKRIERGIFG